MKLNACELYNKLKDKGVFYLYHANTLTTSISCIYNGGLLSRGDMENRGLDMTQQDSDCIDKQYNVWNDVFLDTVDLHGYRYTKSIRQNLYGPVLFKLKSELLIDPDFDNIWITTNNPVNWDKDGNKYFNVVDEYITTMGIERQRKMITIRNIHRPIPFSKYLEQIMLDDPEIYLKEIGANVYDYAFNKLENAIKQVRLNINIKKHICSDDCYCVQNYKQIVTRNSETFIKYFIDNKDIRKL